MSLLLQFHEALAGIANDPAIGSGDLATFFPRVVELAANALAADGAGLWHIETAGSQLVCRDHYDRPSLTHLTPDPISTVNLPVFMQQLSTTRALVVNDVRADSKTAEVAARFATTEYLGALINVPLRHRNEIVGVLSVHTRAARIWTEEAAIFVATLGDFTSLALAANAQAKVEAQLREEQAHVNLILAHADAVIFSISPSTGAFEYMSPGVRRFTDTTEEKVKGITWQQVAHPDDLPGIFEGVMKVYHGKAESAQVLFRIPNDAGEWRWMSATTTVMRGRDGHRRVVGVAQDVTLERQRTQEHTQLTQRLQEAQRMESIGRLAGGVAHDFNNLLTVILGGIDLAALQASDIAGQQQVLSSVRTATERAARLTRQLLAFSRRQVLEIERIDIAEVLTGMNALLRSSLPAHIAFTMQIEPDVHKVRADRAQLEQAIVSIAMNAAEAMPDAGQFDLRLRNLHVDTYTPGPVHDAPPGSYAWLEMHDTGRGIRAQDVAHVFEPFFSSKPFEQGGGLGLAAVFGVVKQHQGYIDLETKLGVGTTFHILLPALVEKEVQERGSWNSGTASGTRILVVEDEPAVRELAALILAQNGYTAIAAADVEDAMRRILEDGERFELLITDVIMPTLNGVELYTRLHAIDPCMRVLYISGYAQDNLPAQIEPSALSAYLQKPFTLASLRDKVDSMLRPPSATR